MKRFILISIFVLATFLRVYALWLVPPSASLDEASLSYNAYSLLKTGSDEYGTKWPLLLRAYDDWRPALYVYMVIPFVWVFGVTAFAVRFPSALLSIIAVCLVYKIGELIGEKYVKRAPIGLISSGIFAISPWHIYISRLGHEANLGFTLVLAGVYYFLSYLLRNRPLDILIASVCFGCSPHAYQSQKVLTPLLVLAGSIVYWKEIARHKKHAIASGIIVLVLFIPAVYATFSPQGMVRFRATSAFSPNAASMQEAVQKYTRALSTGNVIDRVFYSRYPTIVRVAIGNYITHVSPAWLFTGATREAFKAPNHGLLYWWEGALLVAGIISLMRLKASPKIKYILLVWAFVSPIPASITTQAPHAMRAYTMLVPIMLIQGLGGWYMAQMFAGVGRRVFAVGVVAVMVVSVTGFIRAYFVQFPDEQSDTYQYAMKDAIAYAVAHENMYHSIDFSHQGQLYQSYMFYLFYSAYDPAMYIHGGGTGSGGYEMSHYIGKYAFGFLPRQVSDFDEDTLYFYDINHVPSGANVIEQFYDVSGEPKIAAVSL